MTTPFWCLFVLIFFPYVLSGIGGAIRIKTFGKYDNKQPRAQAAQLEGVGARAYAAQQNLWESMAIFSMAVFVAHFAGADAGQSATAALVFMLMRVVHAGAYLMDIDMVRSLAFTVGYGCCIWLFWLAIQAG
ncbi:MAG: MAPEG family protein [Pseudomonadales bacterium]|nr:MAPEG family protein [Pseudomonadales bacterium]